MGMTLLSWVEVVTSLAKTVTYLFGSSFSIASYSRLLSRIMLEACAESIIS
jgi:hypothetical protein